MPVGAIVGGIATLGGAAMSSNAAKKQAGAVKDATDSSNATNLQIYNQQRQDLMPWMNTGKAALSQIEKLLGLPSTPQGTQGGNGQPVTKTTGQYPGLAAKQGSLAEGSPLGTNALATTQYGAATPVSTNATAGQYDSFYNSPGYQFRLGEGQRQLNTGLASRGQLFSGDAGRSAIEYGQNFASNEFNTHLNQLFNAAGMGQTSTGQSNQAGQNYAQGVQQNNNTNANALASSYGTQANAWGNALGTLGGMGMKYWG